MANNEDTYTDEWYLSNTIDRFLSEDLYLIRHIRKKQRRQDMKSSFYHDKIEGPQKVKAFLVAAERDDVSTTTAFDEIGQIVLYENELYVYTKDLEYKKITIAS